MKGHFTNKYNKLTFLHAIYGTNFHRPDPRNLFSDCLLTHKGLSVSEVALYSIVLNSFPSPFLKYLPAILVINSDKRNSLMLGCFLLALHSFTMIISKKPVAFMILAGLEGFAYTFVTGSNSAFHLYDILKREHTET